MVFLRCQDLCQTPSPLAGIITAMIGQFSNKVVYFLISMKPLSQTQHHNCLVVQRIVCFVNCSYVKSAKEIAVVKTSFISSLHAFYHHNFNILPIASYFIILHSGKPQSQKPFSGRFTGLERSGRLWRTKRAVELSPLTGFR